MPTTFLSVKNTVTKLSRRWRRLRYPLLAFAAGSFLGAMRLGLSVIPTELSLFALLGATPLGLCAWGGSTLTALLLRDADAMVFSLAGGILVFAASRLFPQEMAQKSYFRPLSAAFPATLLGVLLWIGDGAPVFALPTLFLQPLLTWYTVTALSQWKDNRRTPWRLLLLAELAAGGTALCPLGLFCFGAIFAAGYLVTHLWDSAVPTLAFAMGWGLDLALGYCGSAAALTLAVYLGRVFPKKWHFRRGAMFFLGFCTPLCIFGAKGELMLSLALGTLFGLFLPEQASAPRESKPTRLTAAATALQSVAQALGDTPSPVPHGFADVFDRVTADICAHCVRFPICWNTESSTTYRIFCVVGKQLTEKGQCTAADFPKAFADACPHFFLLVEAVNTTTRTLTAAHQQSAFRSELRSAVALQYRLLSDFLQAPCLTDGETVYSADYAVCSIGKTGKVCGDKVAGFRTQNRQYLLLCDGMGTGASAAREAAYALRILTALLRRGMSPESALSFFNAAAVLRDFGGCTAIDLACADLQSGEVLLYKWGSAPSYLKYREKLIKVGTASLPPGIGVGNAQKPKQIRLSLKRGEVLILTSDGIGGEKTESLIRSTDAEPLQELANRLASHGSAQGEDDATAAVFCLRNCEPR